MSLVERTILNIYPPESYNKRQWVTCRKCGAASFYDYLPNSLSSPVMWLPCGHGLGNFYGTAESVSAIDAYRVLVQKHRPVFHHAPYCAKR